MSTAAYRDIKADILRRITSGEWPPGSQLPNELDLAGEYNAARATVSRAMRELAEDGLLERRRKAGTRVRSAPLRHARFHIPLVRREIEALGCRYRYLLVDSAVMAASPELRERLGLAEGDEVRFVSCLHLADDAPYMFEQRWIALGVIPAARGQDFTESGPNEWLVSQIPFSTVEMSFSATGASEALARHLGCDCGDALFMAERTTWWEGRAITFVRLVYHRGYRMTTQL